MVTPHMIAGRARTAGARSAPPSAA